MKIKDIVDNLKAIPEAVQKYLFLNVEEVAKDTDHEDDVRFVMGTIYGREDITIPPMPINEHPYSSDEEIGVNGKTELSGDDAKKVRNNKIRLSRILLLLEYVNNHNGVHNALKLSENLNIPHNSVYDILGDLKKLELLDFNRIRGGNAKEWFIRNKDTANYLVQISPLLQEEFEKVAGQITAYNFLVDRIKQMYADDSLSV